MKRKFRVSEDGSYASPRSGFFRTEFGRALLVLFIIGLSGVVFLYIMSRDLPSLSELESYKPKQSSKVYSSDLKIINEFFEEKRSFVPLEELPDDRPEDIRAKELAFRRYEQTEEYRQKKQLADAWCTAFVIKKHFREPGRESSASGITQGHLNDLASGRPLPAHLAAEVEQIWLSFQEALRKNRRKYPREEFVRFVTAVRRYADVTREAALVHRGVVNAVNGLTDFLRLERESVPGEVVYEADRLECVVFLGFDPHFEGDEPPGL